MLFDIFIVFILGLPAIRARKNVLFLMSDDLRPELGAYDDTWSPTFVQPKIHTPHLDALASKSILFKRAYVQQALCGPSRTSIMTGRRPDTNNVRDLNTYFREVGGNFTTLPQYFRENGYTATATGKIFHGNFPDPLSWSEPRFNGKDNFESLNNSWRAVPDHELLNKPLRDRQVADYAIGKLREFVGMTKANGRNFFLAVGFNKPHLPFVFPNSVMEKYYPKDIIGLPHNSFVPRNSPKIVWKANDHLRRFKDIVSLKIPTTVNTIFPEQISLELRRAYYSAVTWIDSLVGEVIKELFDLGLANNTIISFVSDHGYHLGENGLWGKRTNFELSTRVPMMICIPGLTDKGIKTEQFVETVDLYSTLAEAAGLEPPRLCPEDSRNIRVCTEGRSLLPLIKRPDTPLKSSAFTQNKRGNIMGYTLRTKKYRYTEWVSFREKPYKVNWTNIPGIELYDHVLDPEENYNRAKDITYKHIRNELSQQLRSGWRHSLVCEQVSTFNLNMSAHNKFHTLLFYMLAFCVTGLGIKKGKGIINALGTMYRKLSDRHDNFHSIKSLFPSSKSVKG